MSQDCYSCHEPCCRLKIRFRFPVSNFFSYMRASGHAAGARVCEPWVCGTSTSLFQLTVKAPLALLVCQPERQQSESATSSSWVCATSGHLDPLASLMKQNAYLTRWNAFVNHLPLSLCICTMPEGHPVHLYFVHLCNFYVPILVTTQPFLTG